MSQKTKVEEMPFIEWVETVTPPPRRTDALALDALFCRASGFEPVVWTGGIVGYGVYDYTYASGRSGTWMATGFAPRKDKLSVYIMPGYTDYTSILDRLGPHKMGKSCLYITRLERIDTEVLAELIVSGLRDLRALWPVRARL